MQVYRRAGKCRKGSFAGSMIGMNVRGDDRFDAHIVTLGEFQIVTDLKLRIDDRGAALATSTKEI